MASKRTELEFELAKYNHNLDKDMEEKKLKTQRELLKRAKEKETEAVNINIGNALRRQLASTDEDGIPLAEELVAKSLANLKHKDKLTVSEISQLQNMLGENKTTVDVNVDAKGDMEAILKSIVNGKGF
jgi:hypothetical protein